MMEKLELQTPCFIVDVDDFKNNIRRFQNALKEYYKNSIVSYSVKTNSLPLLLDIANREDCFCEVVSYDEFHLAVKMGVDMQHIVYNGPLKDEATLLAAVNHGAYVNIETQREIDWLIQNEIKDSNHLGIRLNIDLDEISPKDAKEGEGNSRFGFSYKNGEFQSAVSKLEDHGIKINGIHIHRTSATRSLNVYKNICEYVSSVIKEIGLELQYIDIGGGFYGNYKGKPDYIDYVKVISEHLHVKNDSTVIVEPGNALVASSIQFLTSVIDKKDIDDTAILVTDESRIDIDPFFHKKTYQYEVFTQQKEIAAVPQKIVGCTCLENDILMILPSERKLQVGDQICFHDQGAYTMTLTPNFIRLLPRVYALSENEYALVRNPLSVDDWMATSILERKDRPSILFSNAGRRGTLIKDFKKSLGHNVKLIATDNWCVAPALFEADEYYVTPKITDPDYISRLIEICKKENVKAITTCIDPEIELLAQNRELFIQNGILPLCPDKDTAALCFDKYKMYEYLAENGIKTIQTFDTLENFEHAYQSGKIKFPVFIKPRCGSGSVGISKVENEEELKEKLKEAKSEYIIQEYMAGEDFDADVYIDAISNEAVAVFSKKKIETRIGGASKTISFKDEKLFAFIQNIVKQFKFYGPVDMDFFYQDGEYYLSEINPRFGGAYLHAFGAGVDFPKMILNNMKGITNDPIIGDYDEGVLMLMYDEVVITTLDQLRGDYND